jgi:type IV pilus assembly protein PilM
MFNLFKQEETALGFDLSDISIKVMQLAKENSGYRVVAYADHNLPKGLMVNDIIVNEEALIPHLQEAVKRLDFGKVTTNRIVASIPESKAFVRVIQIPLMSEEQAVSAVPFEAEQYIPIPIEQVNLDWEILSRGEEKMDVLVTASPRDYVETFLNVFKKAGLRPISFEVESAACARALIAPDKKDVSTLIMDMNTYRTSLIIVENGHLQFTSSVPIAGDAFTQSIARALGVNGNDAEKIKRAVGLGENKDYPGVREALAPVIDNLVSEVKNIIKFNDEHAQAKVQRILLCGGSAKLVNLPSYLYQQMSDYSHIDIMLGDPWINVATKNGKKAMLDRETSISYTTAMGLAIRGANSKL